MAIIISNDGIGFFCITEWQDLNGWSCMLIIINQYNQWNHK